MNEQRNGGWVIGLSFLGAFVLTALPMPEWAQFWRPAWVALVLIYWAMAIPTRTGVFVGWLVGIILDVLSGTLLGQHALGLALVAYFSHRWHQPVRVLPLWQQGLGVFFLLLLFQAMVLWIDAMQGTTADSWVAYWGAPVVGTLLWPWVFVILRDLRRKFAVA